MWAASHTGHSPFSNQSGSAAHEFLLMCCNGELSAGSESFGKALKAHVSPGCLSKIKVADYVLKDAAVLLTLHLFIYLHVNTYIVTNHFCQFAYTTGQKFGIIKFLKFMKKVSYVHQGCIYWTKNTVKTVIKKTCLFIPCEANAELWAVSHDPQKSF